MPKVRQLPRRVLLASDRDRHDGAGPLDLPCWECRASMLDVAVTGQGRTPDIQDIENARMQFACVFPFLRFRALRSQKSNIAISIPHHVDSGVTVHVRIRPLNSSFWIFHRYRAPYATVDTAVYRKTPPSRIACGRSRDKGSAAALISLSSVSYPNRFPFVVACSTWSFRGSGAYEPAYTSALPLRLCRNLLRAGGLRLRCGCTRSVRTRRCDTALRRDAVWAEFWGSCQPNSPPVSISPVSNLRREDLLQRFLLRASGARTPKGAKRRASFTSRRHRDFTLASGGAHSVAAMNSVSTFALRPINIRVFWIAPRRVQICTRKASATLDGRAFLFAAGRVRGDAEEMARLREFCAYVSQDN
ncbi:hypothetical protein A0H81_01625 [Grifola frondosa]|uniref:Uncharacterized protein n=1 Tax=Grifola frondosa TaxID=5627 RepID=A0A1C7MK72_GRIFR|nr:hypothetical protein A0H81_01625 [Grifola frondosa]